ncbi:tyrosine-type recombinase/integrase [Vibrio alginolyticus]|uniref:tyrosine-type recombinase/integrase n=2 Tax=Vibrio alginolyticus TaxID=663 RepID=UPI0021CF03C1
MKNFTLIKHSVIKHGMLLMNLDTSEMYTPFEDYVEMLIDNGYASTSIEQYAGHVGRFLDFLYEIKLLSVQLDKSLQLSKTFRMYEDFLTLGESSDIPLVRQAAINIGKKNQTSTRSIADGIEASISLFIEQKIFDHDDDTFLGEISFDRAVSHRELNKMIQNSWFEATKRQFGSKHSKCIRLFRRSTRRNNKASMKRRTKEVANRAFPIEQSVQFFSQAAVTPATNFSKVRDFLLYALLAATGVRTSEALQITIDDIDWDQQKIDIISPNDRHNKGLTPQEFEALCDKGRATSITFMIQPFASIFWSYLKIYMKYHYKTNVSHRFLFQKYNGRPFFNVDRSTRSKTFKKYLKKYDPSLTHLGLHGFRHTYGFYTLNYFPIVDENGNPTNRQGLPMAYVKILLGHQSITSTEVYAKHDIDLIEFMLSAASTYMRNKDITLKDLAIEYNKRQLKILEEEMERLNAA